MKEAVGAVQEIQESRLDTDRPQRGAIHALALQAMGVSRLRGYESRNVAEVPHGKAAANI